MYLLADVHINLDRFPLAEELEFAEGNTSVSSAFMFSNVKKIVVPNSISENDMQWNRFSSLTELTDIIVKSDSPYYSTDDRGLLYNKNKTKLLCCPAGLSGSVVVPESVSDMNSDSFANCKKITEIKVDTENQYYSADNQGLLYNKGKTKLLCCPAGLSGSVSIPESVSDMNSDSFANCEKITEIKVDAENQAFFDNDGVLFSNKGLGTQSYEGKWLVAYPAGKTGVSYEFPFQVWRVSSSAFNNALLHSVKIDTEELSAGAFSGCLELCDVEISDNLHSKGYNIFMNCPKLTSVKFQGTRSSWDASNPESADWWRGTTNGEYVITEVVCSDGTITY